MSVGFSVGPRAAPTAVAMDTHNNHSPGESLSRQESLDFELLALLEREPQLSQREMAGRLGISLGRTNYCLRALVDKGAIKLGNFRASRTKLNYAYRLTPTGISQRVSLTRRFLERKLAEYDRLEAQIAELRRELGDERQADEALRR